MKTANQSARAAAIKAAASLKRDTRVCRFVASILVAGTLILSVVPRTTLGNLFVAESFNGRIAEYTNSGAPINPSLITGLSFPSSIAVSDGFLYVANALPGTVGKYTISGETVNASLISGFNGVRDIAVSGEDLYVADYDATGIGAIGKYTTSGSTINASLIPGLFLPNALAVSGDNLFVASSVFNDGGRIGKYTTSGSTLNASLVPEVQSIQDIAVSGSSLFVSHYIGDDGTVAKYNVDGTVVNPELICCQGFAAGLAVSGTDLYFVGDGLGKYTTSGMVVAAPLIRGAADEIAVDGSTTVPETLSNLWFGLTTAGLLGVSRFLRMCRGRSLDTTLLGTSNEFVHRARLRMWPKVNV